MEKITNTKLIYIYSNILPLVIAFIFTKILISKWSGKITSLEAGGIGIKGSGEIITYIALFLIIFFSARYAIINTIQHYNRNVFEQKKIKRQEEYLKLKKEKNQKKIQLEEEKFKLERENKKKERQLEEEKFKLKKEKEKENQRKLKIIEMNKKLENIYKPLKTYLNSDYKSQILEYFKNYRDCLSLGKVKETNIVVELRIIISELNKKIEELKFTSIKKDHELLDKLLYMDNIMHEKMCVVRSKYDKEIQNEMMNKEFHEIFEPIYGEVCDEIIKIKKELK